MKKFTANTILITGGGSGIGYGLAKRFAANGNQVIICGRRQEQLEIAKRATPSLETIVANVATEKGRRDLADEVLKRFPNLNILVNNAGQQNRLPPLYKEQDNYRNEIAINLEAPSYLSMLLLPHLVQQADAAIINVTSGLAFTPASFIATYCATKAGLHSFTWGLRHQLKSTPVSVIEVIPPAVMTDLGGTGLHQHGVPLDEYCDHVMTSLEKGLVEFGYESSETRRTATRQQLDEFYKMLNKD